MKISSKLPNQDPLRAGIAVLCSLFLCLTLSSAQAGKLYKWVDDQGNVQYGDSIPPEYIKKEHKELSDQGVTVKSVDRVKTKEERMEEVQRQELEKQQKADAERKRKEHAAQDRVLLDSYLTEDDIIRLRDSKMATIEGTIRLTEKNMKVLAQTIEILENTLSKQKKDSENYKKTLIDIEQSKSQLSDYDTYIAKKKKEQKETKLKYDGDLERFRELKARN